MSPPKILGLAPVVCLFAVAWLAAPPARAQASAGETDGWETCYACHDQIVREMRGQIHLRIQRFEVGGRRVGCEGCHGDGTRHAADADPTLIQSFSEVAGEEICLSCHQGAHLFQWPASVHAIEEVGCLDCHTIHGDNQPLATCQNCHGEVVASFQLPSHHPVREGKMDCASCHDVHAATEAQLRTGNRRLNDLCFTCHLDKEGPFVFEHEPVVEDCSLCHTPHGSVADNLLTANEPMLCLQCHEFHFHAGYRASELAEVDVGGIPRENPFGVQGFQIAMTTKCTQCHIRVHGSDLPSQSVPGQGRGLTQ